VFFFLSKLLDVAFSPFSWGLVLLALAVPWRTRARAGARARATRGLRRRRAFGIAGFVVLLVASSQWGPNTIGWSLEHATTSTLRSDVTYDAVVLLGGVVDEEVSARSGQPAYNENVERVLMTYRLMRDNKAKYAIVSGGTLDKRFPGFGEADLLGRQLEEWGIAKDRIILDPLALNTRENALYAQRIAKERGFERVVILTSAFHMLRAEECFVAIGMKVDTYAVDYRAHERSPGLSGWLPRAGNLATTTAMTREIAGRWVYRAQGYGKSARP